MSTGVEVTGPLTAWVHALTLADVPAAVRERAKHLLLDGVGCALIGAQLPWSRVATDAVIALEGAGDAVIIGTGRTTSPSAAAVLNGTFVQGFELDDFHPLAPLHSNSLILPSLMSTAETLDGVSGAQALLAAIVGFEVGPRVGLALHGAQMLSRGWHSGAVFGTHTSAMAAGKLRALDPAGLEDALGLAGTQSAGLMAAQYEAMSKRMHHGFAARAGFYAAGLAAAGYTGIKRVFEREYGGFLAVFGEGHDPRPQQITAELGTRWETSTIMVKSYAAMGGLHGAIDAARALLDQGLDPEAIARIDLTVGHAVYHHGWWRPERPLTAVGAQMNIGYATVVALLDGNVLPEQFTPERIDADDVWTLLERTHVHLDETLTDAPMTRRFRTVLRVTLDDGSVLEKSVDAPHGSPLDPVTNDEVVAKFRALMERVIDEPRARAIERAVLALEDLDDLGLLADLLASPVAGALDSNGRTGH
ncbi:MmgE/PrpD family protein [Acrocarpospora macrocephala]|uniref:MmgE/PrpD family protein n=1 Tax=Acrocarpospora macrocephala TaxID=150177 RepID=A0A5M3WIL8_9ACTN|nr:MmgE/PrpD family protein [Acrocarpospora macrocephala]GES08997.1 MmgE/PrpD family protein [Acrocarpospora macrocephala]